MARPAARKLASRAYRQRRWQESLRARAALSPTSAVPALDTLLAPEVTKITADLAFSGWS